MMNENALADWWTPSGWQRRAAPAKWLMVERSLEANPKQDYQDALRASGYRAGWRDWSGAEDGDYGATIHRAPDHLRVEVWNASEAWVSFFVAADHRTAFLLDALPGIVQRSIALARAGDEPEAPRMERKSR